MPLSPPPRDAENRVRPHDHCGILDEDYVIRRIPNDQWVHDPNAPHGVRPSSVVFRPSSESNGGMSVDLQRQIEEANLDPKQFVSSPKFTSAVRYRVNILREQNFQVGYDPLPDNQFHGEVWGDFSRSRQKWLLKNYEEFVRKNDVQI